MTRRLITDRSKIRSAPARSETLERIPSAGQAGCDSSSAHQEQHDSGYVRDKSSAAGYLAHWWTADAQICWQSSCWMADALVCGQSWMASCGWAEEDLLRGSWILVRAERGANPIAATASNTISTPLLDPVGPVKAGSQHPVEPLPLLRLCHPLS